MWGGEKEEVVVGGDERVARRGYGSARDVRGRVQPG